MRSIIYLSLLGIIQSIADTTICTIGFTVSSASFCSASFGPCATSDFEGSVPTYATRCLSCFNDASLLQIGTSHVCIPIACTSVVGGNICGSCQPGYSLTINHSCILNFVNSTNGSNLSMSNTPENIISSLIISAAAIICVILFFIFKLLERCRSIKDPDISKEASLTDLKN